VKKCQYCTADIAVEAKKCRFCGEWVEPEGSTPATEPAELKLTVQPPTRGPMKTCPYCSAQIPKDAWICMYCKRGVIGGRPLAIGVFVVMAIFAAIFFFGFWLPRWIEMGEKRKEMELRQQEFDREWNKARQEQEEFRKRHFPGQ